MEREYFGASVIINEWVVRGSLALHLSDPLEVSPRQNPESATSLFFHEHKTRDKSGTAAREKDPLESTPTGRRAGKSRRDSAVAVRRSTS
jgi:hypothetical protein